MYSSVTGLLLAGVGHVTEPPDSQRNFLVVDHKTEKTEIANAFRRFTQERKDIGIVLINQHVCKPSNNQIAAHNVQVAEMIREDVEKFQEAFPAVLEIPSKDHPYDPEKDSVLRRVRKLFGD
jgi:V-type H+-transporting ATPase subunit F